MGETLRVAEALGCLSLATDLAMAQPLDFARTACVLAVRLAEACGFDEAGVRDVYDYAHLRYVGCNAETDVLASLFGDEMDLRREIVVVDQGRPPEVMPVILRAARRAAAGEGPVDTARTVMRALLGGGAAKESFLGHCEVGQRLGTRLGFGPGVIDALGQLYGRWDGKGVPAVKGDAVSPVVMCVTLAQDALIHDRLGGAGAAADVVKKRSGGAYRPDLAETFLAEAATLLADLDAAPTWQDMLDLEPGPPRIMEDDQLEDTFLAIADFADIKSPWRLGHSPAVATLAAEAARRAGLPATDVVTVGRAGMVHDVGTVGVSAGTWGHPGPLDEAAWEQVRLHPYNTERVLSRSPLLAAAGAIASLHHERADGSGYHRGMTGASTAPAARILAAADVYCALTADRPHRPARAADDAATVVRAEVTAGRLDGDAAEAVLVAAGHQPQSGRTRTLSAGLTERELEVLRLVARGRATKQIARELFISAKTADNHIQRVYDRIGVRTRAGATLFAMEHGLV